MAKTNRERVESGLELLRAGLAPYVKREFENKYGTNAPAEANRLLGTDRLRGNKPFEEWDVAALLRLM